MKKIFTLLFVVGMFTMAQAQPGTRYNQQNDQRGFGNGRDIVVNNPSYDNGGRYNNSSAFDKERDMQIARINQEFDLKIQKVKRNFFMSWYEKQRQISFLQEQRQREISMVYAKSHDRDDHYSNNGGRDDHPFRH